MPATFSLSLTNPTVTTPPENVVYSGLSGGNTLDLAIGNNFGYPMTIGGNSTGQFLAVLISDNILDATAAAALGVQAPWSIHSIVPPLSGGGSYTFNLAPPTGGIIIPNLGSITLELSNLLPTAKGIAQVQVQYQFDNQGDGLNLSASLSVIGAVNPDLAQLIGDDAPLRFSYYVNTGDSANPVMVSASPVTAENAVENLLQLNLLFQETMRAIFRLDSDNGNLVNAWDPGNPPVFRIFFPYFSVNEKLPAALDLTDSLSQADPSYNAITSAWNIAAALDPDNAKITQNGFWQIGLDRATPGRKPLPVYRHCGFCHPAGTFFEPLFQSYFFRPAHRPRQPQYDPVLSMAQFSGF